jgi:hypothetical protein
MAGLYGFLGCHDCDWQNIATLGSVNLTFSFGRIGANPLREI